VEPGICAYARSAGPRRRDDKRYSNRRRTEASVLPVAQAPATALLWALGRNRPEIFIIGADFRLKQAPPTKAARTG
jgi:hypothetical protein